MRYDCLTLFACRTPDDSISAMQFYTCIVQQLQAAMGAQPDSLYSESWYRRHRDLNALHSGCTAAAGGFADSGWSCSVGVSVDGRHASSCQRAVDSCAGKVTELLGEQEDGLFDGLNMFE